MKFRHPTIQTPLLLDITVKEMNDATRENGLVPIHLVFVAITRFWILSTGLPDLRKSMEAIKSAQTKMNSIVA